MQLPAWGVTGFVSVWSLDLANSSITHANHKVEILSCLPPPRSNGSVIEVRKKKKQLNCLKLSRRWWVHPSADIGWPLISYVSSIALGYSEILLAMHKYGNSMSKLLLTQLQEFWTLYLHMTASILTSQRVAMRIQWHNTQVFWNSTCRSPIWAIAVGISWQM